MRYVSKVLASAALWFSVGGAAAQVPTEPGFSAAQPAPPAAGWTQFREPSEGAFTVDVPQGWRATGGLRRYAPSEVPTWLTVESPDGGTQLFLGDPAITGFFLPSAFAPEGSQMPGIHGRAATVMRYRPGAEYAAMYGTRSLAAACSNVQVQGSAPLPKLEDDMRGEVQTATRIDAGETRFACQRNGQNLAAAVDAGTVLVMFPGGQGAGFWAVGVVRGYLTPAGNEAQAAQLLEHVTASFKLDAQFQEAVKQANQREEQAAQAANQQRLANPPPAPRPAPYTPTPSRLPQAAACPGDLQQQQICNLNDGHLVVTGGCLKCI